MDADARSQADLVADNETVKDKLTGLPWAKETIAVANWGSALTACMTKTYDGLADWRLPMESELLTLLDLTTKPSIDTARFPNASDHPFWTSSLTVGGTAAWVVLFSPGPRFPYVKTITYKVRCVREASVSALASGKTGHARWGKSERASRPTPCSTHAPQRLHDLRDTRSPPPLPARASPAHRCLSRSRTAPRHPWRRPAKSHRCPARCPAASRRRSARRPRSAAARA